MEIGLATASSKGSLAALGASVVNLGSTSKAFILSHPMSVGFVLGAGTVYSIGRMVTKRRKRKLLSVKAA